MATVSGSAPAQVTCLLLCLCLNLSLFALVRTLGGVYGPAGSSILSLSQNLIAHLERPFPNTIMGISSSFRTWDLWVAVQTATECKQLESCSLASLVSATLLNSPVYFPLLAPLHVDAKSEAA